MRVCYSGSEMQLSCSTGAVLSDLGDRYVYQAMEADRCARIRSRRIFRKRVAQLKKRIRLFLALIFALTMVITAAGAGKRQPEEAAHASQERWYSAVTVEGGDTVWSICMEHLPETYADHPERYVREVKKLNHLPGNRIYPGEKLILPYYPE